MALCTRCGRQTEGAAEFCSGCGSYQGSRDSEQPQAVAAMTGAAGYLRPFTSRGRDGTELPPDPVSTPPSRYWSLQPASPSGQGPEPGRFGADDPGRLRRRRSRYRRAPASPCHAGRSSRSGQPTRRLRAPAVTRGPATTRPPRPSCRRVMSQIRSRRLHPAAGPDQAVQAYDPRPQYARPVQPDQGYSGGDRFGSAAGVPAQRAGGAAPRGRPVRRAGARRRSATRQPGPASASGSGLPGQSGPRSPADLAGAADTYPQGGYPPSRRPGRRPGERYCSGRQAAAVGYPAPARSPASRPADQLRPASCSLRPATRCQARPPASARRAATPRPAQSAARRYPRRVSPRPAAMPRPRQSPTAGYCPGRRLRDARPVPRVPDAQPVLRRELRTPGQLPAASYPAPDQARGRRLSGPGQRPPGARPRPPRSSRPRRRRPAWSHLTPSWPRPTLPVPRRRPGRLRPANRASASQLARSRRQARPGSPADSRPGPTRPGRSDRGPNRPRGGAACAAGHPSPDDSAFPAEDEANERTRSGQRGGTHSGRWIPFAAAAVVLIVCAVSAAILLSQSKTPAKNRPGAGPTARPRQPSPTPGPTRQQARHGEPGRRQRPARRRRRRVPEPVLQRHQRPRLPRLQATVQRCRCAAGCRGPRSSRGYGSSQDSLATLQSIAGTGTGELAAAVTFTSHQRRPPARSTPRATLDDLAVPGSGTDPATSSCPRLPVTRRRSAPARSG